LIYRLNMRFKAGKKYQVTLTPLITPLILHINPVIHMAHTTANETTPPTSVAPP